MTTAVANCALLAVYVVSYRALSQTLVIVEVITRSAGLTIA